MIRSFLRSKAALVSAALLALLAATVEAGAGVGSTAVAVGVQGVTASACLGVNGSSGGSIGVGQTGSISLFLPVVGTPNAPPNFVWANDNCKIVNFKGTATTYNLPAPVPGLFVPFQNNGSGTVTLNAGSAFINTVHSIAIPIGSGGIIVADQDGSDYALLTGINGGGAGAGVSSFNTRTGAVTLLAADISSAGGLLQSNNLSDIASAPLGRVNLNIDEVTPKGDTAYPMVATDRCVFTNANLTAPRVWTLPAASSVNAGQMLCVYDAFGGVTATNTLTVVANGSDTIGSGTQVVINAAHGGVVLVSDHVSKWTVVAAIWPQATVAHQFVVGYNPLTGFVLAQPGFGDLAAGTAACSQLPNLTGAVTSSGCATTLANSGLGAGSCTNCNVTFGANGLEVTYSNGSASGVSVTPADPGVAINPNPGTTSFTVGDQNPIDARTTTSETVDATTVHNGFTGDVNRTVTFSNTLPTAVTLSDTSWPSNKGVCLLNINTGLVTVTPSSGTINGVAAVVLPELAAICPRFDGANWQDPSNGISTAQDSITAHAGGGQANATPLTMMINNVTTVATAADSVELEASFSGALQVVANSAANALQLFGKGSDTVNGAAFATGVSLSAGVTTLCTSPAAGKWTCTPLNINLANVVFLNVPDQNLTGGFTWTNDALGTFSSGTVTIDCGARPGQSLTNNGPFTLAAPATDGQCTVAIANGATAGAVTFSGFSDGASNTGDTLDTTNGHVFLVSIVRVNGKASHIIHAQQ